MTPARFLALLRVRGPALEHWPGDDRVAARRLIAASRRCRSRYLAALDADQTLDDPLGDSLGEPIDPAVRARLQDGTRRRIARTTQQRSARDAGKGLFGLPLAAPLRFGTLAACGLLGVWLGWRDLAPRPSPDLPSPFMLSAVQVAALDPGTLDDAP